MTLKQYQKIKLIIVFILSIAFSQSIIFKMYLPPIALLIAGYLLLIILRRKVTEIIADERDFIIGGKSALWAMQIYSWLAVISMFILYAYKDINPAYKAIALTLAFSTCFLMLLYGIIFRYYNKIIFHNKKYLFILFFSIFFIILTIFTVRLFSGEDNWICQNGQWIMHGHPDFPMPTALCQ